MHERVAILCGFDRSGSSMVAKVLARHPQVECFFQPDNETVFHRTHFEHWPSDHRQPDAEAFFEKLLAGELDWGFIAADWFKRHSTSVKVKPGKLHLIKSTKLHMKVEWLAARFPRIPFYAVHRDPRAILCSLLRNDFYRTWYGESAFQAAAAAIDREVAPP
jgi:hypothetical protein